MTTSTLLLSLFLFSIYQLTFVDVATAMNADIRSYQEDAMQGNKEALAHLEKLASDVFNPSQADSQFAIGELYEQGGFGIERNHEEAVKWFQKAASGGFAEAKTNLEKLANNGNGKASFAIGKLYEQGGVGIERNHEEAVKWFQKAAENGDKEAISYFDNLKAQKIAEQGAQQENAVAQDESPKGNQIVQQTLVNQDRSSVRPHRDTTSFGDLILPSIILFAAFKYLQVNFHGVVINVANDEILIPGPGVVPNDVTEYVKPSWFLQHFRIYKYKLSDIRGISTQRSVKFVDPSKTSKGSVIVRYLLTVNGDFGSHKLTFHSEQKRDQLYSLIRELNHMGTPIMHS